MELSTVSRVEGVPGAADSVCEASLSVLRVKRTMRGALAIGLATLAMWGGALRAEEALAPSPKTLSELMAGMRTATGVVASFTETKELALLSSPLEAAGTIYFIPPNRLVRVMTKPGQSRLVVDGDNVRFEEGAEVKKLDLSSSPVARQLIDSFVVLFNGDEKRLIELYTAEFTPGENSWRLKLLPRSMPLDRMISSFELSGTGAHIHFMQSVEPDGDRTTTRFGETDVHHRFSDAELAELFGPPSSS